MAIDKAVDSAVLDANLTSIADAIRAKAGTSDKLAFPAGFAEAIAAIVMGPPGEFTLSPVGFTRGSSGSFVLAEDTRVSDHYIDMGFVADGSKPFFGVIFSDDADNVYSETNQTLQLVSCYDAVPEATESSKQSFSSYCTTDTSGSPTSSVTGMFASAGNTITTYSWHGVTKGLIKLGSYGSYLGKMYVHYSNSSTLRTGYYMANKRYLWFALGNEVQ